MKPYRVNFWGEMNGVRVNSVIFTYRPFIKLRIRMAGYRNVKIIDVRRLW